MKPIDVVRKLVEDNPNDMMLGEVVRQYIKELETEEKTKTDEIKHFADGFHEGNWEDDK